MSCSVFEGANGLEDKGVSLGCFVLILAQACLSSKTHRPFPSAMWSPNLPSLPLWLLLINSYPYLCLPHNPAPDLPLETSSLFHLLVRSVSITETAIPAVRANLWRDRNHSWGCCLRVGADPHYAASPLRGGAKADYFSRHILISSNISGLTVSSGPAFWMLDRLVK